MIYLINPSDKRILDNSGDRMPIGLMSIATHLEKQGHDVNVYDMNHDKLDLLLDDFQYEQPEAVGISVYTSPIVPEAIYLAKQFKGKTHLIAGGYHATAMPETLLTHFNTVVQGEGEKAFEWAMLNSGIVNNFKVDLDDLDSVDYDHVDLTKYQMQMDGMRTGTIISSRGCFGDCSFCGKLERKVRFSPIRNVLAEASKLKRNGFEAIYFVDDVFTLNQGRMKTIVENIDMPFRVTSRADLLGYEKMKILADNGCTWLSLGIESGNNEVLKKSSKGMTTQENFNAVKLAKHFGIKTKGFFIIGLPGETEHTAKQTIAFAKILKDEGMESADFYYLTPFPGTPIWNNPDKFGIEITDRDYTKYLEAGKSAKCYVNTDGLPANRIEELLKEARESWDKPTVRTKTIKEI